ncbi:hypothetical protein ACS0TY_017111 [Phlomoides rotata]
MFLQLHEVYDPKKIKTVSGTPCGAVAAEAKRNQANWVVLDKYYLFCKFATVWAGQNCTCTSDFDQKPVNFVDGRGNDDGFGDAIRVEGDDEIENMVERPILRILGHCLLGPLNVDEVKDAASMAVRRLYARASHDLVPQAILATKSLIQLDKGAREAAKAAATTAPNTPGSNANTPSKFKKPEILLVSK